MTSQMTAVRVSFRDFWRGFDPRSFFVPLVEGAVHSPVTVVPGGAPCDLEIVSVFRRPDAHRRPWRRPAAPSRADRVAGPDPSPNARVSIWFTGENVRPPLGDWDRYWSFDPTSVIGRNQYVPLWWLQFPELLAPATPGPRSEDRLGRDLRLDDLQRSRPTDVPDRPRFACLFSGWREPTRMRIVEALAEVGQVDVFGAASGRPVATKASVAQDYAFMICPENGLYPGYVTEKVFDAWGAGCIPIWWGLDREGDLNPEALVNLAALRTLDDLVTTVRDLTADRAALTRMGSAALLARRPSLQAVREDLAALLADR